MTLVIFVEHAQGRLLEDRSGQRVGKYDDTLDDIGLGLGAIGSISAMKVRAGEFFSASLSAFLKLLTDFYS